MTSPPSIAEVDRILTGPGAPFEMVDVPVAGRPTRTWKDGPTTIPELLEASAAHGDAPFLTLDDARWSFRAHLDAVGRMANALRDLGVGTGDRVAIAMRNRPEWSIAYFGASAAGAVVVPLNSWWTGTELAFALRDSGATVLVADPERVERVAPELGDLDGLRVVATEAPDTDTPVVPFADLLDERWPTQLPATGLPPEHEATILYTSGTTDRPKGVVSTHRNVTAAVMNVGYMSARAALRSAPLGAGGATPPPAVLLVSVPLFHVTGLNSMLGVALLAGNHLVLMHRWDPDRALELIEAERVTHFGGVPTMAWQVLQHPELNARQLSSVRSVVYGGAPAPPELVRAIEAALPDTTASNAYGLTECSGGATLIAGAEYHERPASVGRPAAVCDVRIAGTDGRPLPAGEVGELLLRGPNVAIRYWNRPEASATTFVDGWLHTGDLGWVDDDGFVYLVDRAKDLIMRGGENISSVEVESVLFEHPAVTDVAVIARHHPALGEEPVAVVRLVEGATSDEGELREHVAQRLAAFKVPVQVWIRDEPLPRNPGGKVLKAQLRSELSDRTPATAAAEVLYERVGHMATITLNRPHRRNAISLAMLDLLTESLERAERDPEVRCVVLTGAGNGFCSGLDLKDAADGTGIGGQGSSTESHTLQTRHLPTTVLFEMDTPVVAALTGPAAGYGFDLALGCDLRVMGAGGRLVPGFAKRGIVPESGGTWYLPRLVGTARAAEIGFLGRDLAADRALEIGLVNAVVPDEEVLASARGWAEEIAGNAPLAVQAMKRLFRHGWTEDFHSHTHHVLLQAVHLFGTKDFHEGIHAFIERRPARFEGR